MKTPRRYWLALICAGFFAMPQSHGQTFDHHYTLDALIPTSSMGTTFESQDRHVVSDGTYFYSFEIQDNPMGGPNSVYDGVVVYKTDASGNMHKVGFVSVPGVDPVITSITLNENQNKLFLSGHFFNSGSSQHEAIVIRMNTAGGVAGSRTFGATSGGDIRWTKIKSYNNAGGLGDGLVLCGRISDYGGFTGEQAFVIELSESLQELESYVFGDDPSIPGHLGDNLLFADFDLNGDVATFMGTENTDRVALFRWNLATNSFQDNFGGTFNAKEYHYSYYFEAPPILDRDDQTNHLYIGGYIIDFSTSIPEYGSITRLDNNLNHLWTKKYQGQNNGNWRPSSFIGRTSINGSTGLCGFGLISDNSFGRLSFDPSSGSVNNYLEIPNFQNHIAGLASLHRLNGTDYLFGYGMGLQPVYRFMDLSPTGFPIMTCPPNSKPVADYPEYPSDYLLIYRYEQLNLQSATLGGSALLQPWTLRDCSYLNILNSFTPKLLVVGAEEEAKEESVVRVFPNPAKDQVRVQLPEAGSYSIELIDMEGRLVLTTQMNSSGALDLSAVAPGVYTLRTAHEGNTQTQMLVVE